MDDTGDTRSSLPAADGYSSIGPWSTAMTVGSMTVYGVYTSLTAAIAAAFTFAWHAGQEPVPWRYELTDAPGVVIMAWVGGEEGAVLPNHGLVCTREVADALLLAAPEAAAHIATWRAQVVPDLSIDELEAMWNS